MSDQNALVPLGDLGIVAPDDKMFNQISSQVFLPRVMLMQSSSEVVKTDKIKQGNFAVVTDKNEPDDLGNSFDALILNWRPKAMRIENSEIVEDVYDFNDESYKQIMKDSELREDGKSSLYGPEFLCYIPSKKKYATFFFSNKTARREAPVVKGLLGKVVTFKNKLIKSGTRSWFGITSFESSTPLSEMPDMTIMKEQVAVFQKPVSKKKEVAKDAGRER